jgi:hypothetical protein
VSDRVHECAECRTPIAKADVYMRLGFVDNETYERITRGKDLLNPDILKRLFDATMAAGYPIKKIHQSCWNGVASLVQKSAAVR